MSPPDPPGRARTVTAPPVPPGDHERRIIRLEHRNDVLEEAVDELKDLNASVKRLEATLLVLGTERDNEKNAAKNKAQFWNRILSAVLVALVLAFGGFMFKLAVTMQANHITTP